MAIGNSDKKPASFLQAIISMVIVMAFVIGLILISKGTDWFGNYEKPITTGVPMLVVQDQSLLIFLPGSTYYKFQNKAAQAQLDAAQGSFPAPILPTAVPPKAQP